MLQTLFRIPRDLGGWPLFGYGVLLAMWILGSLIALGRTFWKHGPGRDVLSLIPTIVIGGVVIAVVVPAVMDPGGVPIRGYGVMLLLAVAGGVALSAYRARQYGLDPELIFSLAMWLFVAGIVGARLFYVIEYWERSFHKPTIRDTILAIINLPEGGLVVYGSLIAGGAALIAFIYKHKLPGLMLTDLISPGVALGLALGRIGCFLNGCCYGGACDLPWAVTFPPGSPPFMEQAERGLIPVQGIKFRGAPTDPPIIDEIDPASPAAKAGFKPGDQIELIRTVPPDARPMTNDRFAGVRSVGEARSVLANSASPGFRIQMHSVGGATNGSWTVPEPAPRSRPIHPTQLYSAIDAGLLTLFLLAYTPFRRRDGELTGLVLLIHPISRFLIEIIRIDESAVFQTGLSISQNISLVILAGAVLYWILLLRRPAGVL